MKEYIDARLTDEEEAVVLKALDNLIATMEFDDARHVGRPPTIRVINWET